MFDYGYRLTNTFKISVLSTLLWLPVDVFGFPGGSHMVTSLVDLVRVTYMYVYRYSEYIVLKEHVRSPPKCGTRRCLCLQIIVWC